MASEWARKKAERLKSDPCDCESKAGRKKSGQGSYKRFYCSGCLAAALDAAREEGAQRERWWCRELAETVTDDHRLPYTECPRCGSHIADAIASRGPMLAPEGER